MTARRGRVAFVALLVVGGLVPPIMGRDVQASPPATTVGPPQPGEAPAAPQLPDVATDAGDLTVVVGANSDDALGEGDSNTVFSIRLPDGSVCPGDSANDDWRVQTFIVPAATDVGALRYGPTRPQGDLMYALYTDEGRPFAQVLLAQNPEPGQPAQILGFPPLSFAPFTPDLLPVGRYTIGVACTYFEIGERYWDAQLELTEDTDVQPGERRWKLVTTGAQSPVVSNPDGSDDTRAVAAVAAPIVVAILVGAGFVTIRKRRPAALGKEHAR